MRPAGDADGAAWEAFLEGRNDARYGHAWAWRALMADVMRQSPEYLLAEGPEGVAGVLPMVAVRGVLGRRHLLSMPYLNYGGPVGTPAAVEALTAAAVARAQQMGVSLLEVRSSIEVVPPLVPNARRITVVLDLPEAETLWSALPSKVRSQVRRPRKAGMTAHFGADQVDAFYDVFTRNMRDLGTPVLPRAWFDGLRDGFGDDAVFGTVRLGDLPVAAGCGFIRGDRFEITWASSRRDHSRAAPNMLLYWAFMEHVIERGVKVFDFGRCRPDSGTHRFKLQWGGRDVSLPWGAWSSDGRVAPPGRESPLLRAASRAWTRLPLGVTNALGPMLARGLP